MANSKMKMHKHTAKTITICGCKECDNYVFKGIGALNLLRCRHCMEKHKAGRFAKEA